MDAFFNDEYIAAVPVVAVPVQTTVENWVKFLRSQKSEVAVQQNSDVAIIDIEEEENNADSSKEDMEGVVAVPVQTPIVFTRMEEHKLGYAEDSTEESTEPEITVPEIIVENEDDAFLNDEELSL